MSYVLDALRRADAERARGDLPGLHAQPVPPAAPAARPDGRLRGPWVAIGAGVLAVVLAAAAFVAWQRMPGPGTAVSTDRGADVPPAPGRTAAVAAAPAPSGPGATLPAPAPVPAAAPPRPVLTQPVPPRPVVREPAPPPPPARADAGPASATPVAAGAAARAGAAAPAGPAGQAPTARLPTLAELPASLRQRLPPMAFGGATDSSAADARMLLINGQVFREGDEVAPGLRLERIRLRSAEMRFDGRTFEVVY
jgi:general secretion pathway protein B